MGRVCYHPCQTACNRGQLDEAVGINSVERFLGDEALRRGWQLPTPAADTGKRVLVIGAGPSGLAAAYHLRRFGHAVVICDAGAEAGGMMRTGIPTYRLPRDVLDAEIERMLGLGIELRTGTEIDDLAAAMDGFDAVFLAVGAQLSQRTYIPAGQSAKILDALDVLEAAAEGERPMLGRQVVVYGGGNTAMDAARTARRLGADEALVVYRRTQAQMPANEIELREAVAEGVQMRWLSTISQVEAGRLQIETMELDADGVPQPTGRYQELDADCVILALGQKVDATVVSGLPQVEFSDGVVQVDDQMMTGMAGVFAGGDMVPAQRSVTVAIGHGKHAAYNIDAYLRGTRFEGPLSPDSDLAPAEFSLLNTWYYTDAPRTVRPRLDAVRRVSDFSEVVGGLDVDTALYEARRCLSCGNCFGCDNCFGVCPDNAVLKIDGAHGYAINLDYCKGCGICVAECPCGAIQMEPEVT
jgi:NADPH-dependent glutamate synthase beta subunit-like oxidoreductase